MCMSVCIFTFSLMLGSTRLKFSGGNVGYPGVVCDEFGGGGGGVSKTPTIGLLVLFFFFSQNILGGGGSFLA